MIRHRFTSRFAVALGLAACLFVATPAQAQARPSLEDLQAQIDALSMPALLLNIYESERTVTLTSDPVLEQGVQWDAFCQVGDQAIGGGFKLPVNSFDHHVYASHQGTDPRVWSTSIVVAPGTVTLEGAVYAYCLDLTP